MNTLETVCNMTAEDALEWVDNILYGAVGNRLNDLERLVFLGSWRGQTYEEIYPLNPQYVEKSVGYKLWRKLSEVLGEKVTKKRIQGVVNRSARALLPFSDADLRSRDLNPLPLHSIRIAYHRQDLAACQLAKALGQFLQADGHLVRFEPWDSAAGPQGLDESSSRQWDWVLLINPVEAAPQDLQPLEL